MRKKPDGQHWLWEAQTRYGKSEAVLSRVLVPRMLEGRTAIALLDPPGTLAEKFFLHCAHHGQQGRVVFDPLARTDLCPGYDVVSPSEHDDELQRRAFDEESRDRAKVMLLAREKKADASQNPNIDEGLDILLGALLAQVEPTPSYWFARGFVKDSAEHKIIVVRCAEGPIRKRLIEFAHLPPNLWEMKAAPAQKRFRASLGKVTMMCRTPRSFSLKKHMNGTGGRPGILIVSGDSSGNLSADAVRVAMTSIALQLLDIGREGIDPELLIVFDEGQKSGIAEDSNIRSALATHAKFGVSIHGLVQDKTAMSEEAQNDWNGNTFKAFGRLSGKAAQLAAEDWAIPLLRLEAKYEEKRLQQFWDGYDFRPTRSTTTSHRGDFFSRDHRTESVSAGEQAMSRYRVEEQTTVHYKSYDDLVMEGRQKIMNQRPGYFCFRADTSSPDSVYVPMLKTPFDGRPHLQRWLYESAMAEVLRSPAYRKPVIMEPVCDGETERQYQAIKAQVFPKPAPAKASSNASSPKPRGMSVRKK